MTIAVYWDVKHQIKQKTFIHMYDSRPMCTYARVVCGNKKIKKLGLRMWYMYTV